MKMYAILRNDIWMDEGKAAAQAGHCFAHTTMRAMVDTPERLSIYHPGGWSTPGTKIVLQANKKEIGHILDELPEGIPYFSMYDSGHIFPPHFNGNPILTGIGIGPLFKEESDKLLGDLKLFTLNKELKPKKKK